MAEEKKVEEKKVDPNTVKEPYDIAKTCRIGSIDRVVGGDPVELTAREAKYLLLDGKIKPVVSKTKQPATKA